MSKNQVIADLVAARAERESRDNGTREIAYGRPGGINDPSKDYDGYEPHPEEIELAQPTRPNWHLTNA